MIEVESNLSQFTFGNNGIYTNELVINPFTLKDIDFTKLNGFKNSKFFGFYYRKNFIYFHQDTFKKESIQLDDVISSIDSSPDGNYIVALTKSKRLLVISLISGNYIFKKDVSEINFHKGSKILILPIENNICEIWLFIATDIVKFTNINFNALSEVQLKNDVSMKMELFSHIKMEKLAFTNKIKNSSYLNNICWYRSKNEYIIAAIYDKDLLVLTGHSQSASFIIDYSHIIGFMNISLNLGVNSVDIRVSSDESSIIILDGMGQIYTINFIIGCLSGILPRFPEVNENCNKIAIGHVSEEGNQTKSDILIQISEKSLCFLDMSDMSIVEKFNFDSNFYYFPTFSETDAIFILEICSSNKDLAQIRKIKRLNPNNRLQELISAKLYTQAKIFAEKFHLDSEPIYFNELKDTIQSYPINGDKEKDDIIVISLQQIKKTFDLDLFQKLSFINLTTFEYQEQLLNLLNGLACRFENLEDWEIFKPMLEKQTFQWFLFKNLFTNEYTSNMWQKFQEQTFMDIVFFVLQNTNICFSKFTNIWSHIKDGVKELFTTKLEELQINLQKRCAYLISTASTNNLIELDTFFTWICASLIDAQIQNNPKLLKNLIDFILDLMMTVEKELGRISHEVLKKLELVEVRLWGIREDMRNSDLSWCYAYSHAHLNSSLECCNPSISIETFLKDICLLDRLYDTHSLNLNLDVIRSENGLQLATRILDQTSISDITDSFIKNKLKNFLKEFKISNEDFFLHYITKLVKEVNVSAQKNKNQGTIIGEYSSILKKFLLLFSYVNNKQQRLEALNSFASQSDCPFPSILYDAIEKEIVDCSLFNSTAHNLNRLLKLSRLTPIFQKYNLPSNLNRFPTHAIIRAVLRSSHGSNSDLEKIISEMAIDKTELWMTKAEFYLEQILYCENDDINLLLNYFDHLKNLLSNDIVCLNERRVVVNKLLYTLEWTIEDIEDLMNTQKRLHIMNIFSWLISLLEDVDLEYCHYCVYTTLKLFSTKDVDLLGYHLEDNLLQLLNELIESYIDDTEISNKKSINEMTLEMVKSILEYHDDYVNEKGGIITHEMFLYYCQSSLAILTKALNDKEDFNTPDDRMKILFIIVQVHFEAVYELCLTQPKLIERITERFLEVSIETLINNDNISQYFYEYYSVFCKLKRVYSLFPYIGLKYLERSFSYRMNALSGIISFLESFSRLTSSSKFKQFIIRHQHIEIPSRTSIYSKLDKYIRYSLSILFNKSCTSISTTSMPSYAAGVSVSSINSNTSNLNYIDKETRVILKYLKYFVDIFDVFLNENLIITGCLAISNNTIQMIASLPVSMRYALMVNYPEQIHSLLQLTMMRDKWLVNYWKGLVKKSIIDQQLVTCISLVAPIESIIQEIRHFVKFCNKSKRLLAICSISIYTLLVYNMKILDQRKELLSQILLLVRYYFWTEKLKEFQIKLPNINQISGNDSYHEIGLKMMCQFDMPCDLIYKFYYDFNIFQPSVMIKYFQQMFHVDFSDCYDVYQYKEKTRKLLIRTEEVWQKILELKPSFNSTDKIYMILDYVSPYHYEILKFIYSVMNSISEEYNVELEILDLLNSMTRCSKVSENERLFCQNRIPSHSSCEYLSSIRLPFHMVISEAAIDLIIPELNLSTVHLWIKMYSLLNELSGLQKDVFNEDILRENTARNIMKDFFKDYPRHEDEFGQKSIVFLGDSYKKSSKWFQGVVDNVMLVMQGVTSNNSFIDLINEFIDGIGIAEQLIYLVTVTNEWINIVLQDDFCNNRTKLIAFRDENIVLLKKLELYSILYKHGLYLEHNIYDIYYGHPIDTMRGLCKSDYEKKPNKAIEAIKEISTVFNIDLEEFLFDILKSKFCMQDEELDGSMADYNESIANISYCGSESFEEASKPSSTINFQNFNEIQRISNDKNMKAILLKKFLSYVEETPISLSQWNYILEYLRLVWLQNENENVEQIASNSMYANFQLYRTLLPRFVNLGTQRQCWTLSQYLNEIHKFRDSSKLEYLINLCSVSNQLASNSQGRENQTRDSKSSTLQNDQYRLPSNPESLRLLRSIVFVLKSEAGILNINNKDINFQEICPKIPNNLIDILLKL